VFKSPDSAVNYVSTRAFVIVDVANIRMAVARQLGQDRQADLRVEKLVQLLRHHDYELTGIAVALPTQVLQRNPHVAPPGGVTSQPSYKRLKAYVDELNVWRSRESQWVFNKGRAAGLSFRSLETLQGAVDDDGEIGVDDLIVARAVIAAEEIRRDKQRSGEEILVASHDTDLLHLAQYVDEVPLRVVGNAQTLKLTHGSGQVPWIGLTSDELKFLARTDLKLRQRETSRSDSETEISPPPLVESEVSAVVDAYGLACSAAAALSISELPDSASVRKCLVDLRLVDNADEVKSLTFVVPDVHVDKPPRDGGDPLSKFEKKAWSARDDKLDQLSAQLETDNEDGTTAIRGPLAPAHVPKSDRVDATRLEVQHYIKRYSTLITAAVVRQCLRSSSRDVVVLTDNPDVILALDYLLSVKRDLMGTTRLLRIGVRAQPLEVPRSRAGLALPYVVLTSARLASLVRLMGPSGRSLRTSIAETNSEITRGHWQVVGYEPEVGGVRVRSKVSSSVELVVFDSARFGLNMNQGIQGKNMNLQVVVDPNQPVDALIFEMQAARQVRQRVAVVVERDGDGVTFDYEDDGIADGSVNLGHDFASVEPRGRIVVGTIDDTHHRYLYLLDDQATERPEQRAEVVEVGDTVKISVGGTVFDAAGIQGVALVDLRKGSSVAVVDVGEASSPHYVVISNALDGSPVFRGFSAG